MLFFNIIHKKITFGLSFEEKKEFLISQSDDYRFHIIKCYDILRFLFKKKKEKDNFILLNFKLLALKKIHLLLFTYSTFNFQKLNQLKNLEIHFLVYAK